MLRPLSLLFLFLLAIGMAVAADGDARTPRALVRTINDIFTECRSHQDSIAANHILYNGPDLRRNLKGTYDYDRGDEKREVDRICEQIRGYLRKSPKYRLGRYSVNRVMSGDWCTQEVIFTIDGRRQRVTFVFRNFGGHYLLYHSNIGF